MPASPGASPDAPGRSRGPRPTAPAPTRRAFVGAGVALFSSYAAACARSALPVAPDPARDAVREPGGTAPAPGAPATPVAAYGLNAGVTGDGALVDRLAALRTRHVRLACSWRNWLDERPHAVLGGRTNAAALAADCRALVGAGVDVLVVVFDAPDDDLAGAGFADAVVRIAATLPDAVTLQLANEVNDVAGGWTPVLRGITQRELGADYAARLYLPAVRALRAAGHAHAVVPSGLVGDPRAFLEGMRDAGAAPPVVCCHCYGRPPSLAVVERPAQVLAVFPAARVWLTEVGSEAGLRDDARQARDLDDVLGVCRRGETRAERLYWYVLSDDQGYGLTTPAGAPRAAWTAWRDR